MGEGRQQHTASRQAPLAQDLIRRSRRARRRGLAGAVGVGAALLVAACAPAGERVAFDPATASPTVLAGTARPGNGPVGTVVVDAAAISAGDPTDPTDPNGTERPSGATGAAAAPSGPWWSVDPATSGGPFPGASVEGLLTFRGSPTRSYYGSGPVPDDPMVHWFAPDDGGFCRSSTEGGETNVWCGTGWTGQPALWRWGDRWATAFGAYDGAVHVLDAATGAPLLGAFPTDDLIKGSVSIDPDGYPLLYVGSRDNYLRVIALDRGQPEELWRLSAYDVSPTLWNDDWDGSPLVLGDLLLEGGENGQFHVVKLNRRIGADGKVTVAPRLLFNAPAWDDQELAETGSPNVSVESSVAVAGNVAYTANSGGLIVGWDLAAVAAGARGDAVKVFRFWMGDDTDATIAVDAEGYLYVAAEYEQGRARADEVGQLAKLDPRRPDAPLVWSQPLRSGGVPSGVWASPALWGPLVIVATNAGELVAFDRTSGERRWQLDLPGPTWGSPVVVDGTLIEGDCAGVLHAWTLGDGSAPPTPRWELELGGCIESTPAVVGGMIVVGTRAGRVYGIGPRR